MKLALQNGPLHLGGVSLGVGDLVSTNPRPEAEQGMADNQETDWSALLERVKGENASAQTELVEKLWPQVAGRIQGLCPRRESLEDLGVC